MNLLMERTRFELVGRYEDATMGGGEIRLFWVLYQYFCCWGCLRSLGPR